MSTPSTSAQPSESSSTGQLSVGGSNLKIVGIILAVSSGLLIGSSFVFKKKGLLRSQAGQAAGEGVAYLKSPLWWLGMSMMILGELCNFAAYAFVEAVVVTPLGALSVVVCAILSSIFLKEKLTFFGWLGCALCIIGSVIIALNAPQEATVGKILDFQKLFLFPGFLAYIGVLITASLVIIFYFAPKYGKKSMLWYIFVCSMIGGISVSVTTGLGAAIVTTAQGQNQFKFPFMYFLIGFVVVTLLTEVYYLNVALALFNTAMVTPTYYVIFTFFTLVTTIVLFQGLKSSVTDILTLVLAFLVICIGITVLQMSKIDPTQLTKLDRRSTILLQAARSKTESAEAAEEKADLSAVEDPGIDTLRGSFGTVGSIIRARSARRLSTKGPQREWGSGRVGPNGMKVNTSTAYDPSAFAGLPTPNRGVSTMDRLNGVTSYQLYDAPVPPSMDDETGSNVGVVGTPTHLGKKPTIKFGEQDLVHQYHRTGAARGERTDSNAIHDVRLAQGALPPMDSAADGYPPGRQRTLTQPGETPTVSKLLAEQERDRTLSLPEHLPSSQLTSSAPPTLNPKYGRGVRVNARDVFESDESQPSMDASSSSGNLLSFPSADSVRGGWDERQDSDESRGRKQKKYPKGDDKEDREESVSLWQRGGKDDDSDTSHSDGRGGIRLVPQNKNAGNRF